MRPRDWLRAGYWVEWLIPLVVLVLIFCVAKC